MCIVIDTCALSLVFNEESQRHDDFRPVFEWIINGKGKVVYGGKTYKEELKHACKYLRLFIQLDKKGKTVPWCDAVVDEKEEQVRRNGGYNDAHLVAIIAVTKCKLLCTCDKESFSDLKNPIHYDRPSLRPKIYTGLRNAGLLCDANIAKCCGK